MTGFLPILYYERDNLGTRERSAKKSFYLNGG